MMGASINPEVNQAMSLLSLLADPTKAAAKVAEYNSAKTAHDEALDALQKARHEFEILHDNLTGDHAAREAELSAKQRALDDAQAVLDAKVAAHNATVDAQLQTLKQREDDLRAAAVQQAQHGLELSQREAAAKEMAANLEQAEKELVERQEAADRLHAEATRLKALHAAKLAKLSAIVNDPETTRALTDARSGA